MTKQTRKTTSTHECPHCGGTGWAVIEFDDMGSFGVTWTTEPCPTCHNTGMVEEGAEGGQG